jgi:hypothetical protein
MHHRESHHPAVGRTTTDLHEPLATTLCRLRPLADSGSTRLDPGSPTPLDTGCTRLRAYPLRPASGWSAPVSRPVVPAPQASLRDDISRLCSALSAYSRPPGKYPRHGGYRLRSSRCHLGSTVRQEQPTARHGEPEYAGARHVYSRTIAGCCRRISGPTKVLARAGQRAPGLRRCQQRRGGPTRRTAEIGRGTCA